MLFYPLQFEPILKERIWGGTKLKTLLNKSIASEITGESWEISTVANDVSVVANGHFKGKTLNELIDEYPNEILGTKVYAQFGKQFPLLFKYLDARQDLSIQVHPNDALAQKRHNSFGKAEMWYVLQADENARLIVGFKEKSSPEEYLTHLNNKTLLAILDTKKVQPGDVFMLNTGTIHALGAGIVIAEIQQTSDITYRVYDFDRVDANGNTRELHVDLALEALNYEKTEAQRWYEKQENVSNQVIQCPYFTTNFIKLNDTFSKTKTTDSFCVFMCVEGDFSLNVNGDSYRYGIGSTVLLPAALTDFQLSGQASLLEIYIS
ncbi:type I phosphomannose isomerase catalytic subunit [Flavobacterium sedimenticola]|uniref:Phosphohexomutase n=1 Tax=Flavobacterium sedimenticola TaxID=3043286 RepID=A0ABT6XRB5_9FLAO|nr:type I phosphomannose isomerase catalytic subunit [Flavobacterium sedimenticola]MDI9257634.1 class I mannose-6-phosphate isomerase [Flavobacterium sedimenticola]